MKYFLAFTALLLSNVYAADWLYIQGTEADKNSTSSDYLKPKVWGFIQAGYQKDYGNIVIKNGFNKTPFVMLPPQLDSQAAFEIARARIAIRGRIDKENKINYFFMTEFAENGITKPAGHASANYLTDASITYKAFDYTNVRIGQFKYPGSEEGLRAVFASPYRNFTYVSNHLLLERFIPNDSKHLASDFYQGTPEVSVGAFRDRGAELFLTSNISENVNVSYAFMIGNGAGLSSSNVASSPTYYGYLSSEYLFHKGKGFYNESVKIYTWYQSGERKLNDEAFKRVRYGLGLSYFHDGLRLGAEWIKAKGMIYNGAKDVDPNEHNDIWEYQIAAGYENEADGAYLNAQYFIIAKKLELIARYDYLNRLTNSDVDRREFTATTIGFSYHFKGSTRIDFNYAFRDATAPYNEKANSVLDNTGNLLSIQGTLKF